MFGWLGAAGVAVVAIAAAVIGFRWQLVRFTVDNCLAVPVPVMAQNDCLSVQ